MPSKRRIVEKIKRIRRLFGGERQRLVVQRILAQRKRIIFGTAIGLTAALLGLSAVRATTKEKRMLQNYGQVSHQLKNELNRPLYKVIPKELIKKIRKAKSQTEITGILQKELTNEQIKKINELIEEELLTNPEIIRLKDEITRQEGKARDSAAVSGLLIAVVFWILAGPSLGRATARMLSKL